MALKTDKHIRPHMCQPPLRDKLIIFLYYASELKMCSYIYILFVHYTQVLQYRLKIYVTTLCGSPFSSISFSVTELCIESLAHTAHINTPALDALEEG